MEQDVRENVVDVGLPLGEEHNKSGQVGVNEDVAGDEFVAVDETSGMTDAEFAERIYQRAAEDSLRGNFKLLPRFNYTYVDSESFTDEIEEWFEYKDNYLLEKGKYEFSCRFKSE
jgi:hypothetical protein